MGLQGKAAIIGFAEYQHERKYSGERTFMLSQWAELTAMACADAGVAPEQIDGLVCGDIREANMFVPATIAEYLGKPVNYAERVDLGGATAVGMVWRAAAAIELGICDLVICAIPALPVPSNPKPQPINEARYFQSSSANWGSPQAEFEIPYGNLAQNAGYALIAGRYGAEFGYDEHAMAKLVSDQRSSGAMNPNAAFFGKPVSVEDVLASKVIADPLHMLEIVMPVAGGGAVLLASERIAEQCANRPVRVTGFGEQLTIKTPTYAKDMVHTPVGPASAQAFAMSGTKPTDMDMAQIYDCYTITVLLTLEDAGFCPKGTGMAYLRDNDLSLYGELPINTHGGQLSMGQAGGAGGMTQVVEAARQLMGRADQRQLGNHDLCYVSGTGGVMSEQSALILAGAQ